MNFLKSRKLWRDFNENEKQLLQEISDLNKKLNELLRRESESTRIIEILRGRTRKKGYLGRNVRLRCVGR